MKKDVSIRIYYDNNGVLQAQSLHDEPIPEDYVFTTYLPIGNVPATLYFTDMESDEAQRLSLSGMEEIMTAIGTEGTRATPQDEQYYMLQFTLHPSQNKHRNKLSDRLAKAIKKHDGWMNHVVLTVAPNTYRLDLAVSKPEETRQAIGRILKQYAVTDFEFRPNDF